jgi:hypothetical protein
MNLRRENRALRAVLVLSCCVVCAGVAVSGRQVQRVPGPGSGIVTVSLVNDARVNAVQSSDWRVMQQGDWRVAQQGEWRVGVQGTVTTASGMPSFIGVGQTYDVRWAESEAFQRITIRSLVPGGWAEVAGAAGRVRWVNLARASSIEAR